MRLRTYHIEAWRYGALERGRKTWTCEHSVPRRRSAFTSIAGIILHCREQPQR
jgi:hypothetical protein